MGINAIWQFTELDAFGENAAVVSLDGETIVPSVKLEYAKRIVRDHNAMLAPEEKNRLRLPADE